METKLETPKTFGRYAIALTAALGLFMAVLDNTIVNVALTPMLNALRTDLNTIQWVVTAYFLAQAAVIPIAGYFATRFGSKRVFLLSLTMFTLGSVLCGLAPDVTWLIIFRVVQGIGGGALFPIAASIAFAAFPPAERGGASAVVGIPVLLAPVFGPTIGGLLTDNFGWEYIFFVNLPIGIAAVFLAWRIIPNDNVVATAANRRSFDYVGLTLSILGVLAVVYAFALVSQSIPGTATPFNPQGDSYGWGYSWVWITLATGLALLLAFALYELRFSKDPVLDLRLFQNYDFMIGSFVSWVVAAVVFGSIFLLPVFLERVRIPNLSPTDTGLSFMPQGIAAAIATAIGGTLYSRIGPRPLVVVGSAFLVVSSWMLTSLTPSSDGFSLMPAFIIRGFGFGLALVPVQTLALQNITGPALAKASSLYNVTRQIFSSIGIAVLATLFTQQTLSHVKAPVAGGNINIDPNSPIVQNARAAAATAGMNDVFWIVTIGTVVLLLVSLALPSKSQQAVHAGGEHKEQPAMAMAELATNYHM